MSEDDMNQETLKAVYLAGFMASQEGWNGECPFEDSDRNPEDEPNWCKQRDIDLKALASLQVEGGEK
jgi:hypothetical protein